MVIAPKKMLKSKDAMSDIEEFGPGLRFRRVLDEAFPQNLVEPSKIRKVLLCSGQVHHELARARDEAGVKDVALVRIEELHPFPYKRLRPILEKYANANVHWVQEEHRNQGPWKYVQNRIDNLLTQQNRERVTYIGRGSSCTTSEGYNSEHLANLAKLLKEALA